MGEDYGRSWMQIPRRIQVSMTDIIIGLKKDVEKLLEQSSTLFGEVKSKGYFISECEDSQKEIQKRVNDLKSMNAKMLIMAPMKAGKSTLINAICGKRILPTRNTGMTTIPTEIVFKKEKKEPSLELNGSFAFFENIFNSIKHSPHDWIVNQYAHLEGNIKDIESAANLKSLIDNKTVEEQLFILNDLVRINSIRDSKAILSLTAIPSVSSSFYGEDPIYKGNNEISNSIGTLTIIDAPGKNESGINHQLEQFILSLTDNIYMVLLVFDYTQLKSLASEEISNEVKRLSEVIGQDKIYIIINKIDQRGNEHDSNKEQTIKSIKAGMDFITEEKIFEVSARYGFAANTFISERDTLTEENFREKEICNDLANVIWPTSLEDFEDIEFDKFCNRAKKVYEKLGEFLDKALRTIIKNMAPDMIQTSLEKLETNNQSLRTGLKNTLNTLNTVIKKIQQAIEDLKRDKLKVDSILENRKKIDNTLNSSHNQIDQSFSKLNEEINKIIKEAIETVFNDIQQDKNPSVYAMTEYSIGDMPSLVRYKDKEIADRKINELNNYVRNKMTTEFTKETNNILEKINNDVKNIFDSIQGELTGIMDKIKEKLGQVEINNFIKTPISRFSNFNLNSFIFETKTEEKKVIKTEKRFYTLWLYNHEYEDVDKTNVYIIYLNKAKDYYIQNLENYSQNRKKEIKGHLERALKGAIESHFSEIKRILDNYTSSLEESIKFRSRSKEDQENTKKEYEAFVRKFDTLEIQINKYKNDLTAIQGANHV